MGYLNTGNDKFKETSKLRSYTKSALTSIIVYTLLCIAILFLAHRFLLDYITIQIPGTGGLILYSFLTILAMAVFINGIAHAGNNFWPEIPAENTSRNDIKQSRIKREKFT